VARENAGREMRLKRQTSGIFVGRHRETGEPTAALDDAVSGRGRLVC